MSSTRGREQASLFNFSLQDFGALMSPGLRDGTALHSVMLPGNGSFAGFALAPHSDSLAQSHTQSVATTHGGELLPLARHAFSTTQTAHTGSFSKGHDAAGDHTGVTNHPLSISVDSASSVFAPTLDMPAIAAPQVDTAAHAIATAQGFAHAFDNSSHHILHNGAPPPAGIVTGQLWFGGSGANADDQLGHIDSDAAARDVADLTNNHVAFQNVGLDSASGLYFGMTADGLLRSGHITNDQETNEASQTAIVDMVFGNGGTADKVQALAVDPLNHIIFVGLRGQSDQYTGILEVQYDPITGALTSPYNASVGVITDYNHVLMNDDNTGKVGGVNFSNVIAMQYDMQNGNLYYVDQTNGASSAGGAGANWQATNGIYVVGTNGTVGGGTEPTPTLLSLNSQFAAGDNNNYIEGLAVNEAQGLIYFAVNNASTNTSKLYYMSITGGTATQMSIPAGVTFGFANSNGAGVNPLAFDPNGRQLYVSDSSDSHIVQFTLSADGHSFTSGNDAYMTFDGTTIGSSTTGLYFDPLPTLSALSATSTEAVQGGSPVTLLTAAGSISDPQDGAVNKLHMGYLQAVVANAQAGDRLFYNGLQSGTFDSGKMTISWNASTHTLTLTGNETQAAYDTFFQNITFQDSGVDNSTGSHPTRTIDWIISDGTTIENQTTSSQNEQATTVTIDRAPTVVTDSYAVFEGAAATGTGGTSGTGVFHNDSDKDGDVFTVTAVNGSGANVGNSTAGTYGHLTLNANGSYGYVADNTAAIDAAPNGSHPVDSFTYTVSDGLGGVTTTTVTFTVDRAPTVVADNPSGEALESGAPITGNVLTNDSDKDGDTLTVSAVNGVGGNVGNSVAGTYGHITINSNGTYSYTADNTAIDSAPTGSHLTDTFTYTANDGFGGTTSTSITVTVDRAPTVVADNPGTDAVESGAGLTGNVLTNDSDRDGDILVVSAVAGSGANVGNAVAGTYGHINIHADGSYTYVADNTAAIDGAATGSHLTDTFTYTANDGLGGTTSTSITVTVDRAPTVVADNPGTDALESGASLTGNVLANDSDRDGDTLVVSAVAGSGANVGNSTAGTYGHLTLNADGSYSYVADNTAAIDGAATGSHLTDTFTYTASDGLGGTTSTSITFTVDRAPTVVADNPAGEALESGSAITGNVLTNDSDKDGDSLTVSAVNGLAGNVGNSIAGTYGHITINSNGTYSYAADNAAAIDGAGTGSHLTDTFTYTANDGLGGTTTTSVTVTVDRAPTVVADNPAGEALESGSAITGNVLTNDSDKDGDSLTVSAVGGLAGNVGNSVAGTYGHITINSNGTYSYTADNTAAIDAAATGSHLSDTFTYTASDGLGGTTSTSVTVILDRAPTVVNDSGGTVAEGGSTSVNSSTGVLANDSDRDGDSLTISSVAGSAGNVGNSIATTYGHVTLTADGSYTYTADNTAAIDAAANGAHPLDTVTFAVSDGLGGTTIETLSFSIDRAASATADSLSTAENGHAVNGSGGNPNLLANDVDKDGDAITITAVNGFGANVGTQILLTSGALLTVNANGSYIYNPNHAFDYLPGASSGASNTAATDTFSYTVDGGSTVTVTVHLTGVDSNDTLVGTIGNDTIHGGIGNDIIYDDNGAMSGTDPHDTSASHSGGTDTFFGDSGNDTFFMGANLTASDHIDGGSSTDTVVLNGDYSGGVVFNATTMVSVEYLNLTAGHSYNLTMNNATVVAGRTMIVQGGTLRAGSSLTFDASADTTGGRYIINSGAGNDVLTGGHGNDFFRVGSGIDTVHGGSGNDTVNFGGALTAADSFDGGAGDDTVYLKGNYSAGLVLGATTLVSVETLELVAGNSYNLTMNAATVAAGDTLTVGAALLLSTDSLVFNGSADTAGGDFAIFSGAGNDVLTGGVGNDTFAPGSGNDIVHGGGGDDVITMGAALTAADIIDGGTGNDTVFLDGDYSGGLNFSATTMSNVERITLRAGHSYNLTIDNATVAAGQTMLFAGNALGASDSFVFDGSHDTSGGSLAISGGAGNDTLTGGWSNDVIKAGDGTNIITGGGGSDILLGGSGADTFVYNAASDSTSTSYDKVTTFDASADTFKIAGHAVIAIDTAITSGHLSSASFDADLAAAVNSAHLAAHDAVLFTADTGTLHGHNFLVVDVNGIAGYQAGQDIVIDLTGGTHLNSLSTANFVI